MKISQSAVDACIIQSEPGFSLEIYFHMMQFWLLQSLNTPCPQAPLRKSRTLPGHTLYVLCQKLFGANGSHLSHYHLLNSSYTP